MPQSFLMIQVVAYIQKQKYRELPLINCSHLQNHYFTTIPRVSLFLFSVLLLCVVIMITYVKY